VDVAEAEPESSSAETFSWLQVQGAFQYTVTAKPGNEQERLVAWLKWRISVTPVANRWLPAAGVEALFQIHGKLGLDPWQRPEYDPAFPSGKSDRPRLQSKSTNALGKWQPSTTTDSEISAGS
jgi:hypothetical protein